MVNKEREQIILLKDLINITLIATQQNQSFHERVKEKLLRNDHLIDESLISVLKQLSDSELGLIKADHPHAKIHCFAFSDFGIVVENINSSTHLFKRLAIIAQWTALKLVDPTKDFEIFDVVAKRLWHTILSISENSESEIFKDGWCCYEDILKSLDITVVHKAKITLEFSSQVINWTRETRVSDPIDKIIEKLKSALNAFNEGLYYLERVKTLSCLADAYLQRTNGSPHKNYEKCIETCNEIINSIDIQAMQESYAHTLLLIGKAYDQMSWIEIKATIRTNCVKNAIEAFQKAGTIFEKMEDEVNLAIVKNSLGVIFSKRVDGDKSDNIEKAIEYTKSALGFFSDENMYSRILAASSNLGNFYLERIKGDPAENIEQAIQFFMDSANLSENQCANFRKHEFYACLGKAFALRKKGNLEDNYLESKSFFSMSLESISLTSNPYLHLSALGDLGEMQLEHSDWFGASNTYKQAIDIIEHNIEQIKDYGFLKRFQAGGIVNCYRKYALAKTMLGQKNKAWYFLAIDKARIFTEIFLSKYDSSSENSKKLIILQYEIISLDNEIRKIEALDEVRTLSEKQYFLSRYEIVKNSLKKKRSELELHRNQVPESNRLNVEKYEHLLINFQKKIKNMKFVLLDFYFIRSELHVAIISPTQDQPIIYCFENEHVRTKIRKACSEYILSYFALNQNQKPWIENLGYFLQEMSPYFKLDELIPFDILESVTSLFIIPNGYLHYLPFHAFTYKEKYLLDYFPEGVIYSINPLISDYLLEPTSSENNNFFVYFDPDPNANLKFSELESTFVSQKFLVAGLSKEKTDNIVLEKVKYIHISTHGYLGFITSAIRISKEQRLTNLDILKLDLKACNLVVFSGCEGGTTDWDGGVSDNNLKLATAFKLAGASNVITALWSVEDFATTILMMKFYELIFLDKNRQDKVYYSTNLTAAQKWLRDATGSELINWLNKNILDTNVSSNTLQAINLKMERWSLEKRPFQSPYYWAAFTII